MTPARGSLLTLGSQAAIAVLTLAATVVIGRTLGPESRGAVAAALLTPVLFGMMGSLGLGTAATYFVARQPERLGAIVGTGLAVAGILGALAVSLFAGASALHFLPSTTELDGPALLALAAIPPAFLLHELFANALRGSQRIVAWNAVYLVQSGANVVILAALALTGGLGVTTAIASTATSYAASVGFGLVALRRAGLGRLVVDRTLVGSLIRYGARVHVGSVVFVLNYRLDALLLQGIAGNYEAGIYATAVAPSEVVWMLGSAIAAVAFPRLASLSRDGIRDSTTRLLGCTIALSLLVGVVAAALGPTAIVLAYGEAFRPAVIPFYWLLPGTILFSVVKLLWVHFAARDQALRVAAVVGGATALDVVLNLLLAPRFGAAGSAAAASFCYAVAAGTLLALFAPPREWPKVFAALREDVRRTIAFVGRSPVADRRT